MLAHKGLIMTVFLPLTKAQREINFPQFVFGDMYNKRISRHPGFLEKEHASRTFNYTLLPQVDM